MSKQGGKTNGVLAQPAENTGAQQLHHKVSKALGDTTEHVVKELNELIEHIEQIQQRVQDHSTHVQSNMKELFSLADQALAFKAQVKGWLEEKYGPVTSDPPDTSDTSYTSDKVPRAPIVGEGTY